MKVIDLYKAGLIISGTDGDEEVINGKEDGGELFFINKVFADLKLPAANSLSQEVTLSINTVDAVTAGVAYYLSLRAADRDRAAFISDLYNAKRASALSKITRVRNGVFFRN